MMIAIEVLLVLAILAFIGYPLAYPSKAAFSGSAEGDDYHKLLSSKEVAFVALKDLEFDYKTGKIDEDDYEKLKIQYEADAVAILKRIEESERTGSRENKQKRGINFCSTCGAKAKIEDRLCSSCGNPLIN